MTYYKRLSDVPEWIQPTMFVGCDARADQNDFGCKIKKQSPVSLPCVPDRGGSSVDRKVILLSVIIIIQIERMFNN